MTDFGIKRFEVDEVSAISGDMMKLIKSSFGPNGLDSLIQSRTGQPVISCDGMTLIAAYPHSNSLGSILFSALKSHHSVTGGQIKTFILLFDNFLRAINLTLSHNLSMTSYVFSIDDILSTVSTDLAVHLCSSGIVKTWSISNEDELKDVCFKLSWTALPGSLTYQNRKILSGITVDIVKLAYKELGLRNLSKGIRNIISHSDDIFYLDPGREISNSRILEGIIFQGHLGFPSKDLKNVKVVILRCALDDLAPTDALISLSNNIQLKKTLVLRADQAISVVKQLNNLNVKLVLSTVPLSNTFMECLNENGINFVSNVPEEGADRFQLYAGIHCVYDFTELFEDNMVSECTSSRLFFVVGCQLIVHSIEMQYYQASKLLSVLSMPVIRIRLS